MRTGILLLLAVLSISPYTRTAAAADTDPPILTDIFPQPGSTNRSLYSVEVFFNEDVTGVDASDLLINGTPAVDIDFGLPGQFAFHFFQPATGTVQVAWAPNNGIMDMAGNPFAGTNWTYVLNPNLPSPLILNEFMADNSGKFLRDEDGQPSDWLEIYNPGADPVNAGGWFLTDNPGNLSKWRIPDGVSIPASGYLVIFASNKNRTNATARLHTNFKLGSGAGGYVALVDPRTN